jgi:thiamine pyrophosphokinase
MHALIVAAGPPPDRAVLDRSWPAWADGAGLVIGADGGAAIARWLGLPLDLAVGDFDSIDQGGLETLRDAGVPVEVAPTAKDESDTELAVRAALARGADRITIVGGLGGRPDHLVANLGLLALPELAAVDVVLVDDRTRISLVRGPGGRQLDGRAGDLVSLLPLGPGVQGVTTSGLTWALRDEGLPIGPSRGLSNVRADRAASVTVRAGLLLVVETVGSAADLC